ncbi:YlxR family protein [bacterium]|nr:YlxR family protein [bacterium]
MTKEIKRVCVACRKLKNRDELIKITKTHDTNNLVINPNSKTFGKSAYLCYNKSCIIEAFKKRKLEKSLKTSLTEEFKEKLKSSVPMV